MFGRDQQVLLQVQRVNTTGIGYNGLLNGPEDTIYRNGGRFRMAIVSFFFFVKRRWSGRGRNDQKYPFVVFRSSIENQHSSTNDYKSTRQASLMIETQKA